jgi:hypothetical protein
VLDVAWRPRVDEHDEGGVQRLPEVSRLHPPLHPKCRVTVVAGIKGSVSSEPFGRSVAAKWKAVCGKVASYWKRRDRDEGLGLRYSPDVATTCNFSLSASTAVSFQLSASSWMSESPTATGLYTIPSLQFYCDYPYLEHCRLTQCCQDHCIRALLHAVTALRPANRQLSSACS